MDMNLDNPSEFLLHRKPMMLVTGIRHYSEDQLETYIDLSIPSIFTGANGSVPAWVGLEYMAQSIAIFAGIQAKQNKSPLKLGFLLGTRKYESFLTSFDANALLTVSIECSLLSDDGLALFDCTIHDEQKRLLARADVKAIMPDDSQAIFKSI